MTPPSITEAVPTNQASSKMRPAIPGQANNQSISRSRESNSNVGREGSYQNSKTTNLARAAASAASWTPGDRKVSPPYTQRGGDKVGTQQDEETSSREEKDGEEQEENESEGGWNSSQANGMLERHRKERDDRIAAMKKGTNDGDGYNEHGRHCSRYNHVEWLYRIY